jgi:hypothetical protein
MADLEYELLGMLTADEESFAVMHADLIRHRGYPPEFPVDHVLEALRRMEESGWITARFSGSDPTPPTKAEIADARKDYLDWLQDEGRPGEYCSWIGPWYCLTKRGWAEWERLDKARNKKDP